MWELFLQVVSLAAVSFGGGQILLAGLERELVQTGRLDPQSYAAAVALGQSTPGPMAAFTTAVGNAVQGFGGGLAATAALMVVSLAAVALISRVPRQWFQLPVVRAGLGAVAPLAVALALYLSLRTLRHEHLSLTTLAMVAGVTAGRLAKLPVPLLVLGAVGVGMAVS